MGQRKGEVLIPIIAIIVTCVNAALAFALPETPEWQLILPVLLILIALIKRGWQQELLFVVIPVGALAIIADVPVHPAAIMIAVIAITLVTSLLSLALIFKVKTM